MRPLDHLVRRRLAIGRFAAAALALAALAAGACGNDLPAYQRDCCVNGIYYVCTTEAAYGKCASVPSDPSGCTYRSGLQCPGTATP